MGKSLDLKIIAEELKPPRNRIFFRLKTATKDKGTISADPSLPSNSQNFSKLPDILDLPRGIFVSATRGELRQFMADPAGNASDAMPIGCCLIFRIRQSVNYRTGKFASV